MKNLALMPGFNTINDSR